MESGDFLNVYVGGEDDANIITVIDCLMSVSRA
jgi:hypothetical protein